MSYEPSRPITALCVGGPKHNETLTYPSDYLSSGVVYVAVPAKPTAVMYVADSAPSNDKFSYDIHRAYFLIDPDTMLVVNTLIPTGTSRLVPAWSGAVALLMFMRGWPGYDEGERWVIERRPAPLPAKDQT